MSKTSIGWTDHSINPIRAKKDGATGHYCEKVSSGCANCYASAMQGRVFKMPAFPGHAKPNRENVEVYLDESKLQEVIRRKKPTKFFWCDMSDMFGEWVPFEWIDKCFATMALTPQHVHQVLTKRPERMAEYLQSNRLGLFSEAALTLGFNSNFELLDWCLKAQPPKYQGYWPLPNVWLGASVEDQKAADERIPHLLRCPAAVRFLSVEPLLGDIDFDKATCPTHARENLSRDGTFCNECGLDGWSGELAHPDLLELIDWVIVGGESGEGHRPMDMAHFESVCEQVIGAGVPLFVKQDSGRYPGTQGRISEKWWGYKQFPLNEPKESGQVEP